MGLLVDGTWQDRAYDTDSSDGRFKRTEATFRHSVTADGAPGPSGKGGFRAEAGRYHLYASRACPWAHRVLIYRALNGLEDIVDVSFVHWFMGDHGWCFVPEADAPALDSDEDLAEIGDRLSAKRRLLEVYQSAVPDFTGRVTVPALWDKERQTIVSNESSELIRMFDRAFDDVGALPGDRYPEDQRAAIDVLNERIYDTLNNGVYRSGFATSQAAHEEAVVPLFETLDALEEILSHSRFLTGAEPLEADWRLLPTLLRFDLVYHGHFKCNLRNLSQYPNLSAYTRDLYQWPGIAATCDLPHAKRHYYTSHESVNPTRIVPVGPAIDLDAPHGRA